MTSLDAVSGRPDPALPSSPPAGPAGPAGLESGALSGPWSCAFWASAPFPLQSKSNFRRGKAGAGRQWDSLRGFESSIGLVLVSARPSGWVVGETGTPLRTRPPVVAAVAARSLVDTANFSKSVLDAAQGILFASDASVLGTSSLGVRAKGEQVSMLAFAQLTPGSGLPEVAAALCELTSQLAALAARLEK